MFFIILVIWAFLCIISVIVRTVTFNPLKSVVNGVKDFIFWLRYKQWRNCSTGELVCYSGLFGEGKTLSAVHKVTGIYNKYNNKLVYDRFRKKWVTQQVHVISNVSLSIPYEDFKGLSQIVKAAEFYSAFDDDNDTLTINIVLGDEFSVQLNSRQFKSNIDPLFLNTLLTCRHYHISMYYTSQRFKLVDALLRQVTSYVIECHKVWRIQIQSQYDAYDLENASTPDMVTPQRRYGWFVRNCDYNAYNTLACVGNLTKSCKDGDMLSEQEILALQCNQDTGNMDNVLHPSRKYRKSRKKMTK